VPRLIGDAYIALLPDATMFRADADAKIKAALAGLRPTVKITGDAADVNAKIAAIAAALKGLNSEASLGINTDRAIGDIASLNAAVEGLIARLDSIPVTMDDSRSLAKIYTLIAGAEGLRAQIEDLGDADFDINRALAKFYSLDAQAKTLQAGLSDLDPNMSTAAFDAKMGVLRTETAYLSAALSDLRANIDDNAALAKVILLQGQVLKLAKSMNDMPMSADTLPLEADLLKAGAAVAAIQAALGQVKVPDATLGTLANIGRVMSQESMIISNSTGRWGFLNAQIRTFGGALEGVLPDWLANIHVWHLGTDAIFEFAAAWGPALIAVGTFGAYAFPVGEKIYGQWKNINTILDGLDSGLSGTTVGLKDLGTGFDQVEAAIEPSIMIAFGEYMEVVTHNSASLGDALTKVGGVIDRWGAQAVGAIGAFESSLDSIIGTGAKDFAQIGYGFEELGKILDDLFVHDMPGYVHILLDLGDAALTMTADFVQFAGPAIKLALAVHGFIVYVGLATTAVYALGRAMVAGAIARYTAMTSAALADAGDAAEESGGKFNAFGTAIGSMAGFMAGALVSIGRYVAAVVALVAEEGIAVAATDVFADAMALIPLGAVGLGIGALALLIGAGLYIAFKNTTDAAAKFNQEMQNVVTASDAASIGANIASALAQTSAEYAKLTQSANAASTATGKYNWGTVRGLNTSGRALNDMVQQQQEVLAGQRQLVTEADNYGSRMGKLATVFGSTGAALSGLNLMGIKASTIAKETNSAWGAQLIELEGLANGYGYMSQSGSEATAQLGALNIATGTVTKNIQTLTQAESAWITMITSGDSAFTTFEQGQATLSGAINQGAKSGDTLRVTLGKLSETFPLLKTNLDGTTQSALAARQAFDAQLSAGVTLFGNLQTLATASGDTAKAEGELASGGKAILASLLPFVAGSKEGVAELSSLAQLMGGPATDNFQVLAKWIGSTKDAAGKLNDAQAALTITASNMTTAEKNLANQLETDVTSMEASKEATSTLSGAVNGLYTASVNARGQVTSTSITLSNDYVNALKKAGVGTTTATQYLNAYLKSLGYGPSAVASLDGQLGKSQTSWEQTISKLKLTKGEADALYHSLQTLGAGSPYIANVKTNVSATGMVKAVETGNAAYGIKNAMLGELQFSGLAAGGVVPGGVHGRDSVPAMLAPGELIVPSSHAAMFGDAARRAGIPGFASGGMVADGIQMGNIVPTAGQAATTFSQNAVQGFASAAKNAAVNAITAGVAGVSGNVLSYEPDVLRAMAMLSIPMSDLGAIMSQMATESGGRVNAVNLTDSNAKAGHPSTGLMQVIAGTFDAFAGPFRNTGPFQNGVSINPLANIYAGLDYAVHEYGMQNLASVLGHGHGYSGGGVIPEHVVGVGLSSGQPYSFGENGPELVVPNGGGATGSPGMQPATNIGQQTLINQNAQIIKLLGGLPQTMGRAISQSAGAGLKAGFYSAQN
jgi:SLT domain-containing protein